MVVSNTRAQQRMILSPFLFTVYTSDFQYNSESYHLQQLPGDAAVVGVLGSGGDFGEVIHEK